MRKTMWRALLAVIAIGVTAFIAILILGRGSPAGAAPLTTQASACGNNVGVVASGMNAGCTGTQDSSGPGGGTGSDALVEVAPVTQASVCGNNVGVVASGMDAGCTGTQDVSGPGGGTGSSGGTPPGDRTSPNGGTSPGDPPSSGGGSNSSGG